MTVIFLESRLVYASIIQIFDRLWIDIKIWSTASAQLSSYPHWLQKHRQTIQTDDSYIKLFTALNKAEPLISTDVCQKFDIKVVGQTILARQCRWTDGQTDATNSISVIWKAWKSG